MTITGFPLTAWVAHAIVALSGRPLLTSGLTEVGNVDGFLAPASSTRSRSLKPASPAVAVFPIPFLVRSSSSSREFGLDRRTCRNADVRSTPH